MLFSLRESERERETESEERERGLRGKFICITHEYCNREKSKVSKICNVMS